MRRRRRRRSTDGEAKARTHKKRNGQHVNKSSTSVWRQEESPNEEGKENKNTKQKIESVSRNMCGPHRLPLKPFFFYFVHNFFFFMWLPKPKVLLGLPLDQSWLPILSKLVCSWVKNKLHWRFKKKLQFVITTCMSTCQKFLFGQHVPWHVPRSIAKLLPAQHVLRHVVRDLLRVRISET